MSQTAGDTTVNSLGGWAAAPALVRSRQAAERRRLRARQRLIALDVTMLVLSGFVLSVLSNTGLLNTAPLPWVIAFPAVAELMLALKRMQRPRIQPSFLDDVRGILAATATAAMAVTFALVLFGDEPDVANGALAGWLTAAALVTAGRAGLKATEFFAWRNGGGAPTLIVGAGRIGHLIAERLGETRGGLRPIAFLDDEPLPGLPSELPILRADELESFVAEHEIEHAILAFSNNSNEAQLALSGRFEALGVNVSVVPRLFEGVRDEMTLERIGGLPLVSMYPVPPTSWRFRVKYAFDRIFAFIVLLLASPLLIAVAIAVAIDLGRPIFYRQTRIGIDGDPFEMLKFRTMRDAETAAEAPENSWKRLEGAFEQGLGPGGVEGGDRRTRLGAFLRRSSIDEIPQLINVLRGDMSLVGPRPERPPIVERFEQQFHRYGDRHRVKPGITGWAQVHGLRGRTSISDRVEWDNYYVENWSPWLDTKIATLTLLALVRDDAE